MCPLPEERAVVLCEIRLHPTHVFVRDGSERFREVWNSSGAHLDGKGFVWDEILKRLCHIRLDDHGDALRHHRELETPAPAPPRGCEAELRRAQVIKGEPLAAYHPVLLVRVLVGDLRAHALWNVGSVIRWGNT